MKFLEPGGVLIITLPNFRVFNGLFQYLFDPENLARHNLKIMNITLIKATLVELGLKNINVQYYPSTTVWLEELSSRSLFLQLLERRINRLNSILSKVFGRQNRLLYNSIVLTAKW